MARNKIKAPFDRDAVDPEAVAQMAARVSPGCAWVAYENSELGHPQAGHLKFLKCGPGCTFPVPPDKLPDMGGAINWRYLRVGTVDLTTGRVVRG